MALRILVRDTTTAICGALSDLGAVYDCQFDNRGGNRSDYIFVRRPIAAKIRISDHRSGRVEKDMQRSKMATFDVRAGTGWEQELAELFDLLQGRRPALLNN
jgi:hypothetical protein